MINRYFGVMTNAPAEVVDKIIREQEFEPHVLSLPPMLSISVKENLVISHETGPFGEQYDRAFKGDPRRLLFPQMRISIGDSNTYDIIDLKVEKTIDLLAKSRDVACEISRKLREREFNTHFYRMIETTSGDRITRTSGTTL